MTFYLLIWQFCSLLALVDLEILASCTPSIDPYQKVKNNHYTLGIVYLGLMSSVLFPCGGSHVQCMHCVDHLFYSYRSHQGV